MSSRTRLKPSCLRRGTGGAEEREGEGVEGKGGVGVYLTLHCHHQDICTKMGGDQSYFKVSLIVRSNVTWRCPYTTTSDEPRQGIEPTSSAY